MISRRIVETIWTERIRFPVVALTGQYLEFADWTRCRLLSALVEMRRDVRVVLRHHMCLRTGLTMDDLARRLVIVSRVLIRPGTRTMLLEGHHAVAVSASTEVTLQHRILTVTRS